MDATLGPLIQQASSVPSHQFHLQMVQRIDVWKAVPDRLLQAGIAGQSLLVSGDQLQRLGCAVPFGLDQDKDPFAQPRVAHQSGVAGTPGRLQQIRHERLPAEHLLGRRLEMMTLAVMSELRPAANWFRIAREWLYGDPPQTELGRQEADYYAGRG